MDIGDVQRFDIDECSNFQRTNTVIGLISVVPAGLITVKASLIDSSVAGAFLG